MFTNLCNHMWMSSRNWESSRTRRVKLNSTPMLSFNGFREDGCDFGPSRKAKWYISGSETLFCLGNAETDKLYMAGLPYLGQSCAQPHSWWWCWYWAGCRDKTPPVAVTGQRCRSAGLWSGGAARPWSWTDASFLLPPPRSGPPAGSDGSRTPWPGQRTHPGGWEELCYKHPIRYR